MTNKTLLISLVVPVYNEEQVLQQSYERMSTVMQNLPHEYEIIYIDDGSIDRTWQIIKQISKQDRNVKGLRFSRNFGHQPAVTAGMEAAGGVAIVIIDADLQDPPELIPEMIKKWEQGYEVVYGQRLNRRGETLFKKLTASMYYRILKAMSAFEIPLDTGDFRLIDKKVADVLRNMPEHNRFLRGMSAWAGFSQCPVEYERQSRAAGKTHYTFKKMIELALNGILGFSDKPLLLPLYIGAWTFFAGIVGFIAAIIVGFVRGVGAWVYAFLAIVCLFGVLLCLMGVQGAYLSRIYDEVRLRPNYIIRERIGD